MPAKRKASTANLACSGLRPSADANDEDAVTATDAINQHLKRIFSDNELEEASVVKQYLAIEADGKGYQTKHFSLQAIIAESAKLEQAIKANLKGLGYVL